MICLEPSKVIQNRTVYTLVQQYRQNDVKTLITIEHSGRQSIYVSPGHRLEAPTSRINEVFQNHSHQIVDSWLEKKLKCRIKVWFELLEYSLK